MVRPTLPSRHPNPARSSRVRLSGRSSSTLPKSASSVRVASATAASMTSATGAPARACWPRCATASCCRAVARSVASVRDNCASRGSTTGRNSRKRSVIIDETTTLHSLGVVSTVGSTTRQCAPSRAGAKRRSGDSPNFPRTPRNRAGTVEHVIVLKDLAVIFAVSLVVILVFHRLKLPALPGFIVSGVLLGPNALGLVSDVHRVEGLAEVGVILLLFTIGIEFSLGRLREMGRQVVIGGGLQMGLTVAVAGALAAGLGLPWPVALFLGCLVALSSTALVLKGLTDKGEIDAPHGRLATGALIFQDLCVVPMMLVLPFLAGRAAGGPSGLLLALGKAVLVVIGLLVVARTVVPRALAEILKTRSRELFLIAIILLGTLTALGTAAAGASLALGAFLAGLVISESDYGHQAMAELLPFRDVFISLFFVAVGMLVQVQFVRDHPLLALGGVGVIMGGKTITAAVGPALLGYSGRVALLAGLAVSQIGEFSFVLAREGRAAGLLAEGPYQTFLAVAVFTMLLTPFLLEAGRARMLVAAISDPAATRRMVRVARALNPRIHIIARTRYVAEIPELTRLGADVVIPEEFETSVEIFARVLAHYNVARQDIERLVEQIRASHYQALRGGDVVVGQHARDRKSTRLNSSHRTISYAVFCLKKKKKIAQAHINFKSNTTKPILHPILIIYQSYNHLNTNKQDHSFLHIIRPFMYGSIAHV